MVNRLIGLGNEAKANALVSPVAGKVSGLKPPVRPKSSQVAGLVLKLQNMAPTQDVAARPALVRRMKVST